MPKQTILHFKRAGLHSSLQDLGRMGQQHLGVPLGGAMDKSAAKTANWLVGNEASNPVIEITLAGPKIDFQGNCQIALTGANLSPTLDGKPIGMYKTIKVKSGASLDFGKLIAGCRCYLAIGGRIEAQQWLSSHSAASLNGPALPLNSIFKQNSQLIINTKPFIPKRKIPKPERPIYKKSLRIRVLAGPEFECFSRTQIATFFSRSHRISNQSNRMGYRLESRLSKLETKREIISSGTIPGTIQITNSGQPILLMMDAQTTGGYYRIATIISADLDKVAQLKPGDELWFSLV